MFFKQTCNPICRQQAAAWCPYDCWPLQSDATFFEFENFRTRLAEILDVVNANAAFQRLEKIELGGTEVCCALPDTSSIAMGHQ